MPATNATFQKQLESTGQLQNFIERDTRRRAGKIRALELELQHVQQSTGTQIDRLTRQKQSLDRHMADLESQLVESGNQSAAISETVYRLREAARRKAESIKNQIQALGPDIEYKSEKIV